MRELYKGFYGIYLKKKIYYYEKDIEEHGKDEDLLHSLYLIGYIDLDKNLIERKHTYY